MRSNPTRGVVLFSLAAIPRILGAFFLPNAFGDAYVYIQEIGNLSTKLANGSFHLTDLFGFWLPLYQFLSGLLNVFVHNGFYSGKIVAALFGAGACVFVYLVTERVTGNITAAVWMFLLIAFNPLHIFYSASAMTDVPHAFFVLAALYFVLTRNWIIAAVFAALAGFTRVESWMLIGLIPAIQIIKERRVSIAGLAIMIVPPLLWFYISWKATGNWLACFEQRQEYHDWLLQMNPSIAQFSLINVLKDGAMLLVSSDVAVMIASFIAAWFVLRLMPQFFRSESNDGRNNIVAPVMFFFAFFALLLVAYLTHQQPIIFPRYGLILFSLGIPILAWTYLAITRHKPEWSRRILAIVIVLCALNWSAQLAGIVGELNRYSAQRNVADYLRNHFDRNSNAKIFCDDGTVQALSGIPFEMFLSPADAPKEPTTLLNFLSEKNVSYLIIIEGERSTPLALFPQAEYNEPVGDYESIMHARSTFLRTDIHVYRRIR